MMMDWLFIMCCVCEVCVLLNMHALGFRHATFSVKDMLSWGAMV